MPLPRAAAHTETTMNQSTFFADSQASTAFVQRLSDAYAFATAALANLLSPALESPAEAASRLRSMAEAYSDGQPSYAADLRAAADRADAQV